MGNVSAPKKIMIVDTSVLHHDPNAILNFQDNIVVTPFPVLEELDRHKRNNENGIGWHARKASRTIDNLGEHVLNQGVKTPGGGLYLVDNYPYLPKGLGLSLKFDSVDNFIIGVALKWQFRNEAKQKNRNKYQGDITNSICSQYNITDVVLVTKDINLRIKARSCGLNAQDYEKGKVADSVSELYTGRVDIEAEEQDLVQLRQLYRDSKDEIVQRAEVEGIIKLPTLFPNQCCIFLNSDANRTVLAIYKEEGNRAYFKHVPPPLSGKGGDHIRPRNDEQALAYALLTDPLVRILTLSGTAGAGKTLMGLVAGLDQVTKFHRYSQVQVYRMNAEMGKDLGFLPGNIAKKWDPWTRPIRNLLELIADGNDQEPYETKNKKRQIDPNQILQQGIVEILPINYLRGDTLHRKFGVIDETQNFKPEDIKKVLQRMGKGSKFILTGDIEQIDDPYLDPLSNGLSHVIERLKGRPEFAHLSFRRSEREDLVNMITTYL